MGVANGGFWGIPVRPGTHYRASFYAKAAGFTGPVHVSLESADGTNIFAEGTVKHLTADWQKYSVTTDHLTQDDADHGCPFCAVGQRSRHRLV